MKEKEKAKDEQEKEEETSQPEEETSTDEQEKEEETSQPEEEKKTRKSQRKKTLSNRRLFEVVISFILGAVFGGFSSLVVVPAIQSQGFPESMDELQIGGLKVSDVKNFDTKTGSVFFTKDKKALKDNPKQGRVMTVVVDPSCSFCYHFEKINGDTVDKFLSAGNTLEVKFIPMLDRKANPQVIDFPIIFANIASQEPDKAYKVYRTYYDMLIENDEARTWDIEAYRELGEKTGVSDSTLLNALRATRSDEWQKTADGWMQVAANLPDFQGTPHLMLDGKRIDPDLYVFADGALQSYLDTGKVQPQFSLQQLRAKTEAEQAQGEEPQE